MKRQPSLSAAVLWAAVILAAALSGAPAFFSLILLPSLAATALIVRAEPCFNRSHSS